jgi:hypothetical protein
MGFFNAFTHGLDLNKTSIDPHKSWQRSLWRDRSWDRRFRDRRRVCFRLQRL